MNSPGCSLTIRLCKKHGKPYIIFDRLDTQEPRWLLDWIAANNVKVLNVAGNRERTNPGIYKRTFDTLIEALKL